MQPSPTGLFKPNRSVDWTRERVERLEPAEIRQLRDNALHLGAQDVVTLCDESLGQRGMASAARRDTKRQATPKGKLVSRRNAFEALGVFFAGSASWSGVRKSDGRVVMALWASSVESRDGRCRCLLWAPNAGGSRPWSDSPAGKERRAHCELVGEHGKADGLLVYGEALEGYLPEDKARTVEGVDPGVAIVFTVERRGEEYWAVWGKKVRV